MRAEEHVALLARGVLGSSTSLATTTSRSGGGAGAEATATSRPALTPELLVVGPTAETPELPSSRPANGRCAGGSERTGGTANH